MDNSSNCTNIQMSSGSGCDILDKTGNSFLHTFQRGNLEICDVYKWQLLSSPMYDNFTFATAVKFQMKLIYVRFINYNNFMWILYLAEMALPFVIHSGNDSHSHIWLYLCKQFIVKYCVERTLKVQSISSLLWTKNHISHLHPKQTQSLFRRHIQVRFIIFIYSATILKQPRISHDVVAKCLLLYATVPWNLRIWL